MSNDGAFPPKNETERSDAYHEAGHAVVRTVLGLNVEYCDIKQRERSAGWTVGITRNQDFVGKGREAVMPLLVGCMAGVATELLVNEKASPCLGGREDCKQAREFAALAICRGVVDASGEITIPLQEILDKNEEITYMLADASAEAERLVEANIKAVKKVADTMLERKCGRVEGHEIAAIVEECRGK